MLNQQCKIGSEKVSGDLNGVLAKTLTSKSTPTVTCLDKILHMVERAMDLKFLLNKIRYVIFHDWK